VELILWRTDTDTFERGQWFKGMLYSDRSDLSPDGSLLIYFAVKMSRRTQSDPDLFPAWTAISRPPWLTALSLWPARSVWPSGGGLFLDNKTILLNHSPEDAVPHNEQKPRGLRVIPKEYDIESLHRRLQRQGWEDRAKPGVQLWEKHQPGREWAILWNGYGTGSPSARYAVKRNPGGIEVPIKNAEWADWDQQGRLVFARGGKLFAGDLKVEGQLTSRELVDLNADIFEARQAPAWAQRW
jgi:hypothetical protein